MVAAAAAAKSLQSCPTLCDPIDGSPPGSAVPGILQARTLEWVAISFSNAGKWKVKVKSLSRVRLLVIPWTAAYQAPPSMGFSRQEYWSGVPLPFPIFSGDWNKTHSPMYHKKSWDIKTTADYLTWAFLFFIQCSLDYRKINSLQKKIQFSKCTLNEENEQYARRRSKRPPTGYQS